MQEVDKVSNEVCKVVRKEEEVIGIPERSVLEVARETEIIHMEAFSDVDYSYREKIRLDFSPYEEALWKKLELRPKSGKIHPSNYIQMFISHKTISNSYPTLPTLTWDFEKENWPSPVKGVYILGRKTKNGQGGILFSFN